MKADIFIPTSNRYDALAQCLESLERQSNKDFHIILVGLCEHAAITVLVLSHANMDIEFFLQSKKGLISAANEALARSTNEIFVRIDDDTILDVDWYGSLISTFESDSNIFGVTGPTVMSDKGLQSRDLTAFLDKFRKSNLWVFRLISWVYYDYLYEGRVADVSQFLQGGVFTLGSNYSSALRVVGLREVSNLEACNWSARAEILKKIGGFDEVYLKGLGDYHESDAALKLKKLGGRLVFNPLVSLQHNVEVGVVDKARPAPYWRIQNFLIFYFRFFNIGSASQFLKFLTNVFLQNCYYIFRFLTTGKINQLGAIAGTFVGFVKIIFSYRA